MTRNISLDLLLSDEVCRLLDCFASTMKIQVVFYSRSGEILRRGRSFGNSRYCTLMQEKFFGMERCIELDNKMQQLCRKEERAVLYCCHAGLYELIAPVKVLGEVAGFVMFGQFRVGDEIAEFAMKNDEIREAFAELPAFDLDGAESLKDMINMLIGYIIDKELVSYSGSMKLQTLHYFINENFNKPVTLHQAAKFMHMSDSSLTHFLRDNHQSSFKQLLIEKRLSHAEKLLRENPALSIAEASVMSGYDDPHYFSRLYRKNRKRTAKSFIDSLRNK
ncbi:MAG: PocR ligand-binding domain-containing protein [Lentisphaeria bacterium]|nr:PocR ligand-binding domain-containing protein [Lentisphaeria bacterium]